MHSRTPCFRAQEFTVLNSRGQMGSCFQSLCSLLWTLWLAPQRFPSDFFQSHLCGNHSFYDGYESLVNVPEERKKINLLWQWLWDSDRGIPSLRKLHERCIAFKISGTTLATYYREWERSGKCKRGYFIDFLIWECIFLCASVQTLELRTETKRWVPGAEFLLLCLLWNSSMPNTDPKLDYIRQNWWGWPLQSLQS